MVVVALDAALRLPSEAVTSTETTSPLFPLPGRPKLKLSVRAVVAVVCLITPLTFQT